MILALDINIQTYLLIYLLALMLVFLLCTVCYVAKCRPSKYY